MSFNVDDGIWYGEITVTEPAQLEVHNGNLTQFRSPASAPAMAQLKAAGKLQFKHTAMQNSHMSAAYGDWLDTEPELSLEITADGIYYISYNPGYVRLEEFKFSNPKLGISLSETFTWGVKAQIKVIRQPGYVYDYHITSPEEFIAEEQQMENVITRDWSKIIFSAAPRCYIVLPLTEGSVVSGIATWFCGAFGNGNASCKVNVVMNSYFGLRVLKLGSLRSPFELAVTAV